MIYSTIEYQLESLYTKHEQCTQNGFNNNNNYDHWHILRVSYESDLLVYFCKQTYPRRWKWLLSLNPLTMWITTRCGKFLKWWEYQTTLPISWETCMWVKKEQLEPDMEQQTSSKLGKEYDKALFCHPAYLTYMQSTSFKMWAGWITSWNRDCQKKISNLRHIDDTTLKAESEEELKSFLMRGKRRVEKTGLKLNIKIKSWHRVPSLHGK